MPAEVVAVIVPPLGIQGDVPAWKPKQHGDAVASIAFLATLEDIEQVVTSSASRNDEAEQKLKHSSV